MSSGTLRRRRLLQIGAAAAAAGPIISCARRTSPWRFFTIEEAAAITAICEQIIPADQDPGAAWAGVAQFLDRQLTGFHKGFQKAYRQGLETTDRISMARFGRKFAELSGPQQIEVMATLEKEAKPFFDLVVTHAMQGFYGSPRHGGNRDAVSWKMLGVPYPPVRGRRKV